MMDDSSKREEILANLNRSRESIQAAWLLLEHYYPDFAASRAYYAGFYASVALLLNEGKSYRKHSGVIAAIHRDFVRTGRMSVEQGKQLNWLFELRGVGDYGMMLHVTVEEARRAIEAAEQMLETALALLQSSS